MLLGEGATVSTELGPGPGGASYDLNSCIVFTLEQGPKTCEISERGEGEREVWK